MPVRNYTNTSKEGQLQSGVGTGDTTITLTAPGLVNIPATPFYVRLDPDTASEEIVLVGAGSSATSLLNCTRGYDGTSAFSHLAGAKVRHCVAAEFYNKADAHVEATTNVHGLSGGAAVVGTSQTQTLTNKTVNASVLDLAHTTSPAASQAVKISADSAAARDGVVWDNTGGSSGRSLVVRSGGVDRFVVTGAGLVVSNSATAGDKAIAVQHSAAERFSVLADGTTDFGLQAAAVTGDRVTIRTRSTQRSFVIKDSTAADLVTIGGTGNFATTGSISSGTTASVGTNLTVTGTAAVTGNSTLTGDTTWPLPAAGTTTRLNINARTGGVLIEGKRQDGTVVYTLGADGGGVANGKWFIHDKASPVVARVSGTGVVPSPTTDMLVFDGSAGALKVYNGATWDVVGRYGTHYNGMTAILDGQLRTTNAAATSGTTELLVLDTGAVSLPASSCFLVDVFIVFDASGTGDDYDIRIRETNVTGTLRQEAVTSRTDNAVPYVHKTSVIHTTTTADTKTFVATIQRIAGTGTATVKATSYILVTYLGPSSLITTV